MCFSNQITVINTRKCHYIPVCIYVLKWLKRVRSIHGTQSRKKNKKLKFLQKWIVEKEYALYFFKFIYKYS